ncbi:MAG TPA: histidine kinase [Microcoleaceae bacterium UBA10368]|nr:histidine kinase [Microcoleaceae cyanobacterium UBA10368]
MEVRSQKSEGRGKREEKETMPHAPCPMPHAPCPMPTNYFFSISQ